MTFGSPDHVFGTLWFHNVTFGTVLPIGNILWSCVFTTQSNWRTRLTPFNNHECLHRSTFFFFFFLESRELLPYSHPIGNTIYALGKKLLHTRMGYFFWRLLIFYLLVRSKGRLVNLPGFVIFPCIVCTILFNVHFDKMAMTFIYIGAIGCMSIHKCHWVLIVVNLVKKSKFFACCCLLVWFCVCWISIGYSYL